MFEDDHDDGSEEHLMECPECGVEFIVICRDEDKFELGWCAFCGEEIPYE